MAFKLTDTTFPALRREFIARDFARLNDMQREGVLTTEGPLLLLAGAGSGKTTVLINRIANLIRYGRGSDSDEIPYGVTEEDRAFLQAYLEGRETDRDRAESLCVLEPCEPWRIIAITFTNKAAGELKDRLEAMLGPDARDIWAMTFHSACARILRRDIDRLGYDTSFTIYDTSDTASLIKRIIKEFDLDDKTYAFRAVMSTISKAKDAMISPEDFALTANKSGDPRRRNIARIYEEYEKRMQNANAVDFDDLLLLTVRLLQTDEEVRGFYQRKFRYVLIDEYQDTNNVQYQLAALLAGMRENICVVGDDDQSIYKFRGATIENILNFEKQYQGARMIRLEQNYRSTGHILEAANAVIAHNTGRKGKNLWTDRGDGDKPQLYVARDERDEASYVANKILAAVSEGDNFRDHAVLYRMNAQSNQLEFAFKRGGIPYRVIGGMKFFDRAEVKDIISYLCVVANPTDEIRLMRIVNQPPRGIGAATLETVQVLAGQENCSSYEIMCRAGNYPELARAAVKLGAFVSMLDGLRESAKILDLPDFYEEVLQTTGYVAMLEAKKSDENITRLENIRELKTNIVTYVKENPEGNLNGFLEEISLYTDIDSLDRSQDCVSLMTMHSAKGLEFDTVFIVGMEEGVFPGMRVIGEQDEMEEERRLCYVAMTRAKRKLYFICARQRMLFGKTVAGQMSRFLEEIPERHINRPAEFSFGGEAEVWDTRVSGPFGGYDSSSRNSYNGYRDDPPERRNSYISRKDYSARRPETKKPILTQNSETPGKAEIVYSVGDRVKHKAFGEGVITSVQPAGKDALLEIEFSVGKKRLMQNTAASFMKKL